jgi:hypothetical protein
MTSEATSARSLLKQAQDRSLQHRRLLDDEPVFLLGDGVSRIGILLRQCGGGAAAQEYQGRQHGGAL